MIDRTAPELIGLVLAGGESRRMRHDKGAIDYHGAPQAEHCHRLLSEFCARAFVSVNPRQRTHEPYCRLPVLIDKGSVAGPAAGLLAAWTTFPEAALLALAVDLPLVDSALLERLVGHRNPDKAATVWVHPDGVVEPLCAIWEPASRPRLVEAADSGSVSLRRLLEAADIDRLVPAEPERLVSVNTAEQYRELKSAKGRITAAIRPD